jgi:CPA2 family monovalent cation:H+ antiporter-2
MRAAVRAVTVLRNRFPDMPIYVRASDQDHCDELARLGAIAIAPEIMEMSLHLGGQTLAAMGLTEDDVARVLDEERARAATPKNGLGDGSPSN